MRVAFVDSQKAEHGVQSVLRALEDTPAGIAPSTYYAAKARPASARSRRDEELTAMIEQVHKENYGVYGARKIWHELHRRGVEVARCTVERLMRESGLRGLLRDRSPRTTRPAAETGCVQLTAGLDVPPQLGEHRRLESRFDILAQILFEAFGWVRSVSAACRRSSPTAALGAASVTRRHSVPSRVVLSSCRSNSASAWLTDRIVLSSCFCARSRAISRVSSRARWWVCLRAVDATR
ncbi:helix-turn-helix protein [Micromonospora sp. Llam0]|uniref:IS3 family transposase n=1 Tax=Micromonospora sp. Llam0 TaxID=2485143 RepID=UPI000FC3668B|nr:IS3 family transposase [Micromonospora sp. Llam0]ROO60567.1 helix-turn-helix protein [Micromonospora sp. Llam0]